MNEPMRCPKCKEITLKHINTETEPSVDTFEEWACECGHYQTMKVPTLTYPGFDDWFHTIDPDVLDSMGMLSQMRLAWDAGRVFEADRTIEQLQPLRESIAELEKSTMGKRQA